MGTGYKNRGSGAAGLGFKNRGAKLVEGAAYTNRGATDGVNEAFKNRGQAWGSDAYYNRGPNDFASLSVFGLAGFYAPLTHSLILTRGTGDPTYSRATSAWEFDNEGKLITVPSGAARFGGARMVWNLVTNTAAGNSVRPVFSGTGSSPPTINNTDTYLTEPCSSVTIPICSGGYAVCRAYTPSTYTAALGVTSVVTSRARIAASRALVGSEAILLYYGSATDHASIELSVSNNVSTSWQEYTGVISTNSTELTGNNYTVQTVSGSNFGSPITLYITNVQYENVTGQADQTASEYVSVGVLSAPYHGAGVDGVEWFDTNKDGSAISESSLLGYHADNARTNSLLYSRDLTKAAWVATNITAAKTATGLDNAANSASTITATAANATILQTISLAAAARSSSAYVKRRTGSGNIYFTRDGGTTWTDITASVGASWTRVKIENSSVLNPSIGFKIATSGDAIDVDCVQDEAGACISSPIVTTTAVVTRSEDLLTYQTSGNALGTVGSCLATVRSEARNSRTLGEGSPIFDAHEGSGGVPLQINVATNKLSIYDGANKDSALDLGLSEYAGKLASSWSGTVGAVAKDGIIYATAALDGDLNLNTTIGIGAEPGTWTKRLCGYIKNAYIWQSALTDAQLQQVTAP